MTNRDVSREISDGRKQERRGFSITVHRARRRQAIYDPTQPTRLFSLKWGAGLA
jgi:hypothetical protein